MLRIDGLTAGYSAIPVLNGVSIKVDVGQFVAIVGPNGAGKTTLSGGQQQMLAIGRGLASSPKLLMLDEPSMGLAPTIADFIFERLIEIRRQSKLTILLVEQRVAEALESADHGYVLEAGRVALEGNNQTLRADDRVRRAYLGM